MCYPVSAPPPKRARCAQLPDKSHPCPIFPGNRCRVSPQHLPTSSCTYSRWCFPAHLTPTSLLHLLPPGLKREKPPRARLLSPGTPLSQEMARAISSSAPPAEPHRNPQWGAQLPPALSWERGSWVGDAPAPGARECREMWGWDGVGTSGVGAPGKGRRGAVRRC